MAWTLASVAVVAAVTGTLAWADVRHRLEDMERREDAGIRRDKALQQNVTKIAEKLGIVISWPMDEVEGQ